MRFVLGISRTSSFYLDNLKDYYFLYQIQLSLGGFAIVVEFYNSFSSVVSITHQQCIPEQIHMYVLGMHVLTISR